MNQSFTVGREPRNPKHPLLSMVLAMLLVGATAPLGELALSTIPLFPVLAVRLVLAWAALALFGAAGPKERLDYRSWAVLALQAVCGVVVFNVGMWLGMRATGPATAGVVTSATPAVMAAIGMAAFGVRLSGLNLAGIVLTVAGVLAARGGLESGWRPQWGDALLLAAVAGESVFLMALKWLPARLSPLDAARRVTCLGFWLVAPLAVWQLVTDVARTGVGASVQSGAGAGLFAGIGEAASDFAWTRAWTGAGALGGTHAGVPWGTYLGPWLAVAALGVLVTAGGYVLWFRGVRAAPAGSAAAVTGLMPVSAVFSSWLLLGLAPTAGQLAGCLAAGAGIWLAALPDRRK